MDNTESQGFNCWVSPASPILQAFSLFSSMECAMEFLSAVANPMDYTPELVDMGLVTVPAEQDNGSCFPLKIYLENEAKVP